MKKMKILLSLALVVAALLSLGVTAFAEEAKTEVRTFLDENGETVTEVYDADGSLIHKEEPYYKDGKKSGILCYDALVWCSWADEKYTAQSGWTLPVLKPEKELRRCLSYTLNMAYYKVADMAELGLQTVFCREDGTFKKIGYLDMKELEEFSSMTLEYDSPTAISGFAIQPYRHISMGEFSLACALTDVYYLK